MKVIVKFDLDTELQALHDELVQTNLRPFITVKQSKALAILMGKCIETEGKQKKEIRIYALNKIAGNALRVIAGIEEITSTKNLTGTMAKILLDLFLEDENTWEPSNYAKRLISALEKKFKTDIGTKENTLDTAGVAT